MRDTQFELMLAIALVVMIIYLFLRNVPATIIPGVAVPLSPVGTFAVMVFLDFSINNLTLMALTIATGFVVDDAIVVIENISRYIEKGEKPLAAALKGAGGDRLHHHLPHLPLIAVLIPLLFMGDIVGRLFRRIRRHPLPSLSLSRRWSPDPDADDVRPHVKPRIAAQAEPILAGQRAFLRTGDRRHGRWLSRVLNHPWLTLGVA